MPEHSLPHRLLSEYLERIPGSVGYSFNMGDSLSAEAMRAIDDVPQSMRVVYIVWEGPSFSVIEAVTPNDNEYWVKDIQALGADPSKICSQDLEVVASLQFSDPDSEEAIDWLDTLWEALTQRAVRDFREETGKGVRIAVDEVGRSSFLPSVLMLNASCVDAAAMAKNRQAVVSWVPNVLQSLSASIQPPSFDH